MRVRKDIWILTLVGMLAGFLTIRAFNIQYSGLSLSSMLSFEKIRQYIEPERLQKIESYLKEKELPEKEQKALMEKVRLLEGVISSYEKEAAEKSYYGEEIQESLEKSRILAGMIDLEGPGIEIVLNDRKREDIFTKDPRFLNYYIVHDSDLLNVINELRAAGAEAIAINGVRILSTSRISCGGPTINVGKEQRFAPPFVIHAIGDPDKLAAYFEQEDSIYHSLTFWGLEFSIKKKDRIEIPRYMGGDLFKYAKPIEEGE